jgi:hypothetical protein
MHTLKQGNRSIVEYIKQAESLAALTTDQSLLRSLARAFINGLTDSINQQIIASQLPIYGFTFKEAKEIVEKVYS